MTRKAKASKAPEQESAARAFLSELDAKIAAGAQDFELFFARSTLRLMLAGDGPGGWSDLKKAFELAPRAMISLAEAALSADKPSKAVPTSLSQGFDDVPIEALRARLSKLLAKDDGWGGGYAWRGLLARRVGDYAAAVSDLARARTLGEAGPAVLSWLGEARLQSGDSRGLEDMEAACAQPGAPAWAFAWLGRARVAFRRDPKALEDLGKALALDPGNGWFYAWRAEAARLLGKKEGVLEDLDRALAAETRSADYERYVRAWKGNALLSMKRPAEAEREFDLCLAAMPGYAPALLGRAEARLSLGRDAEWLADLEAAASADSKHRQGRFWSNPEQRDRARAALNKMAEEGKAVALGWLGALRLHDEQAAEALAVLDRAVEKDDAGAWVWGWRADALSRLDRREEALKAFAQALKRSPDDPVLLCGRARLLIADGKAPEALKLFERAAKADPRFAFVHANLGRIRLLLGDAEKAVADLERAVALNARYATAWADLAAAREATGRRSEAQEAWGRAEALDPAATADRRKQWALLRAEA